MVLTIEEGAEDTVKPRFLAAGGDPSRLHRIVRNGRAAFFKIDEDRERLTSALKGAGIKLMICDPLIDFVSGEQNRDSDVREVLNQLVDLAQEIDFAAGGVNHLNKKSDLAAMHRVSGARGWTSVARINYLVGKGEESVDGAGLRHVCPLKLNLSADDGGSLDYIIKTRPITDGQIVNVPIAYTHWIGKGSTSADDITISRLEQTNEVVEWLKAEMMGGEWLPSKQLNADAEAKGYSGGKLDRARQRLKVETRRTKSVPSTTEWRLPSQPSHTALEAEGA
jgi:hypothetical protein